MTIDSFAGKLIECVSEKLPSAYREAEFTVRHATNPGNVVMTGIAVRLPDSNVTPCIYVNSLYEKRLQGAEWSVLADAVAEQIIEKSFYSESLSELLADFEKAKDHIVSRLIDIRKGHNKAYLEGRVVRRVGSTDIGIIYDIDVSEFFPGDNVLVPITKVHMRAWNVTGNEVDACAAGNNPKLRPALIRPMASILKEIANQQGESSYTVEVDWSDIPIYVVTNKEKLNGANVILYSEIQKTLQQAFPDGYYILPSSVHEMLVVPSNKLDPLQLLYTVAEINKTEVAAEDVLADDVFVIQNGTLVSCTTDDIPME